MVFDTTGVYVYADNTPRQLAAEGKLLVSQKSVKSPFPPANFVCFPIFLKSIMSLVWLFRWMHMVFPFHLSFISVLLDCLIVIQERVLIWYPTTLFATVSDKRGLWIWMFIHSHVDFGLFILASTFTHNSYNGLCLYLVGSCWCNLTQGGFHRNCRWVKTHPTRKVCLTECLQECKNSATYIKNIMVFIFKNIW